MGLSCSVWVLAGRANIVEILRASLLQVLLVMARYLCGEQLELELQNSRGRARVVGLPLSLRSVSVVRQPSIRRLSLRYCRVSWDIFLLESPSRRLKLVVWSWVVVRALGILPPTIGPLLHPHDGRIVVVGKIR